jgi:Flp pilus assembly protein TadB
MELDSLKDIWKNLDEKDLRPGSDVPIMSMLQKRSRSPLAKMKRNLYWEMAALVVCYSLAIWYYITGWQGRYWEVALLLFLVGVFALFYYLRKNKLLNEMQCVACEVKSNLQRQLVTLEKYVNFYFVSSILITPTAYFVAGLIVFFKTPTGLGKIDFRNAPDAQIDVSNQLPDHQFLVTFISIGVILTIGVYFFSRWAINRLYGQHIKKLKELVQQMEEAV